MFNSFKSKKQSNNCLFHGKGIIDVTNFDDMSLDDSLGYMCSCDIIVFQNGIIEIYKDDSIEDLLESFSLFNIVMANNNINNYDPSHTAEVCLMTESKDLRISFQTEEIKKEFWNALTTAYDNLKSCK